VSEVVMLATLPGDHAAAAERIERLAREWVEPARGL
jgi:hypothetical protein